MLKYWEKDLHLDKRSLAVRRTRHVYGDLFTALEILQICESFVSTSSNLIPSPVLLKQSTTPVITALSIEHGDEDILMWTDQICINQSNLRERSHQVEMMYDIYKTAQDVALCLDTLFDEETKDSF